MKTSLAINEPLWESLKEQLLKDAPQEGAAVLLCKVSHSSSGTLLVAHSLFVPEAEDLAVRGAAAVGFKKESLRKLLKFCKRKKLHPIFCHSHPFSRKGVRFSAIDDGWDGQFGSYTAQALPWMLHGSLVVGQMDFDARIYDKESRRLLPISRVRVVGKGLSLLYPTSARPPEEGYRGRYVRQSSVFGEQGQFILRGMTVGIIGNGGTGCHVAQQLAYLGVGSFILVDPDGVEISNLNRLVGAVPEDANQGVRKVEIVRRMIQSIAPEAKVLALARWVMDCVDELKQADVIFGCVDAEVPRLLLTRFPAQYLNAYIDVATGIAAEGQTITEIYGQVRLILPDGPCLSCMGGLSFESIRQELLSDREKAWERRHGYGLGPNVAAPAVVALNGTLASLGVMEFMNLIGRFREHCLYQFYDGKSVDRVAYGVAMKKMDDCPICGWESLGLGDSKDLPNFSKNLRRLPKRKETSYESEPRRKTDS